VWLSWDADIALDLIHGENNISGAPYATRGFGLMTEGLPAVIARSTSVASIVAVMPLIAVFIPRDPSEHEPWPMTIGGEGLFAAVEQMTDSDD
jgi:hypothetical protein